MRDQHAWSVDSGTSGAIELSWHSPDTVQWRRELFAMVEGKGTIEIILKAPGVGPLHLRGKLGPAQLDVMYPGAVPAFRAQAPVDLIIAERRPLPLQQVPSPGSVVQRKGASERRYEIVGVTLMKGGSKTVTLRPVGTGDTSRDDLHLRADLFLKGYLLVEEGVEPWPAVV